MPDQVSESLLEPVAASRVAVEWLGAHGHLDENNIAKAEVAGAILLDTRLKVIAVETAGCGQLTTSPINIHRILRAGLVAGASGIILFHTHPSGDPAPSHDDIEITRKLAQACNLVQLKLYDHLVIGRGFVSMKLTKLL